MHVNYEPTDEQNLNIFLSNFKMITCVRFRTSMDGRIDLVNYLNVYAQSLNHNKKNSKFKLFW